MRWNMNNDGMGKRFEKGVRYDLIVSRGEEGESSNKGTPFLKIYFETPDLEKAYDKTLYNTEKAAYRMIEWAKAMGFPYEGDVDIPTDRMAGIHITAECSYRKADDGKEYLEWINPLPVKISSPAAASRKPATVKEEEDDHIPF